MKEEKKERAKTFSIENDTDLESFFDISEEKVFADTFLTWDILIEIMDDIYKIVSEGWHLRYGLIKEHGEITKSIPPFGNTVYFLKHADRTMEVAIDCMVRNLERTLQEEWNTYDPPLHLRVIAVESRAEYLRGLEKEYEKCVKKLFVEGISQMEMDELDKERYKILLSIKKLKSKVEKHWKDIERNLGTSTLDALEECLEVLKQLCSQYDKKLVANGIVVDENGTPYFQIDRPLVRVKEWKERFDTV